MSVFDELLELKVPRDETPSRLDRALGSLEKLGLSLDTLRNAAGDVHPSPSEAQKEVGNYAKGHVWWKGLGLTIETAIGQYRQGVTKEGVPWKTLMKDHYGYVKGTVSDADGDQVDVFICEDDLDSEIIFVINQMDPSTGEFDEHKCVIGCTNQERAKEIYHRNYQEGWQGFGECTPITLDHFKWWMEHADTSVPIANGYFAAKANRKKAAAEDEETWYYVPGFDEMTKESAYKDCPECGGEMTSRNLQGDTMRGAIRCLVCNHEMSAIGHTKEAKLLPTTHLQEHQEEIAETGKEDEKRLLLYHSLGSGKSLSGLSAAETAGEPYTAVTPASLRPNFRKEQEKFTDMTLPSNLVSYNSIAKGEVPPTPTLVMDEAQRMRNPDSLTTQNAQKLADKAKHIYLLSATPIVNHPHDLAPLVRMLTGKNYSPDEFDAKFVDERKISPGFMGWVHGVKPTKVPVMKNQEEFGDLLRGHVHYYAPSKPDVEQREERFETELGPEQTKLYKAFWDQLPFIFRWKLQNSFPLSKEEMLRASSFLSGPRQVGLSTLPFMRGKADPYKAYQQSPKLQLAVQKMTHALKENPEARGVAFSNFIDAGLKPYGAALDRAKIPYGMFHGGLNDAARKQVVNDYNAGKIRALLLGPSGGEGISLKGTRLLQLLDPHWNEARSDQAVGRGVRYDSHNYLPLEDRNVQIQKFISRMPRSTWQRMWRSLTGRKDEDARRGSPGVDTWMEELASKKQGLNDQFLRELQRIGSEQRLSEAA